MSKQPPPSTPEIRRLSAAAALIPIIGDGGLKRITMALSSPA
jgi:hypothetical protein